jgi:hypothetical protein
VETVDQLVGLNLGSEFKLRIVDPGDLANAEPPGRKYKYLDYVPKPVRLEGGICDFVGDDEFCHPDGRTPLLMVTQYGIFPGKGMYQGKSPVDYPTLEDLENRLVAFVGRGYLSDRELDYLVEVFIDAEMLSSIRDGRVTVNLNNLFLVTTRLSGKE